jgi:protein-disulfide isomerase
MREGAAMKRTNLILLVLGVLAVATYLGISYRSDFDALFAKPIIVDLRPSDHMNGRPAAPVTIVEYASFTCHFCAAFQRDVVPALTRDYIMSGKVRLVFREYPFDPAARAASALARCFSGDSYFAFADQLFLKQEDWLKDTDGDNQLTMIDVAEGLVRQARLTGMGRAQANACMTNPDNLAAVDASYAEASSRYRVSATPTFFIAGRKYVGGTDYAQLRAIIDPLLAAQKK